MGRHVTFYFQSFFAAIFLREGEDIFQSPVVEVILQFVGQIGSLGGAVLRHPRCSVIVFPFLLERVAIASPGPELGFLEVNGVHSGVYDPLDLGLLEVVQILLARHDVRNVLSVPEGVSLGVDLTVFPMGNPIPTSGEIILIASPGYTGHEIRPVTLFFPAT